MDELPARGAGGGEFDELAGGVVEALAAGEGRGSKLILATTKGDMVRQCAWMEWMMERREDRSCGKGFSAEHAQGPYPEHGTRLVPTLGTALAALAQGREVVAGQVVSTACTSGLVAMIEGAMMVERGEAERVMAVGVDVAGAFVRDGFAALKAVSPTVCRPFDLHRNGLMLGSGAAGCLLSRAENADVVVSGWGVSNDAVHMTAPDREARGLIRAIRQALERAELEPRDIDVVFAHGTGTPFNDAMEAVAIEKVFLQSQSSPAVTAVKGLIGHTLGAAGLIEAVLGVEMIRRGMVLPVVGLQVPERAGIEFVTQHPWKLRRLRHLLKIGSGFGGMNAAVVLSAAGDERTLPHAARGGGRRAASVVAAVGESGEESIGDLAMRAAGKLMEQVPAEKRAGVGLVIGTTLGCLETDREFERSRLEAGGRYASPAAFSRTLPSTVAAEVALKFGMTGPSLVVSAGDCSAAVALRRAVAWMEEFDLEYCVAGGVEWVGEGIDVEAGKRVALLLLGREGRMGRLEVAEEPIYQLGAVEDRSLLELGAAIERRRQVLVGGVRVVWD